MAKTGAGRATCVHPPLLVLLLLVAVPTITSRSAALERLKASCKKTLWLVGADFKAGTSFLDEGANVYAEHLLVALKTAEKWAPSLVPVVILYGDRKQTPAALVTRIQAAGATVLFHHLSFELQLRYAIGNATLSDQLDHGGMHLNAAFGSFLRVDLPNILPKVLSSPAVSAAVQQQALDVDFVLWTDPDIMFFKDINSCSLPQPKLLSIGPDLSHGVRASCGVIYFNVAGYAAVFPDLMEHAVSRQFMLMNAMLDQGVMVSFMRQHTTLLPDIYNYKPYWGTLPLDVAPPAKRSHIAILHIQGPKLAKAMCVMDHLTARYNSTPRATTRTFVTLEQVTVELAKCVPNIEATQQFLWTTRPLVEAFNHDGGALYRAAAKIFKQLLPPAAASDGTSKE